MTAPLTSRANPRVRHWSRLAQDARYRRKAQRTLIEGPHLLAALLEHGLKPVALLGTESGLAAREIAALVRKAGNSPVILSERLFRTVVDAENPPGVAAEIAIPKARQKSSLQTVFLEGVQDPGNVGAIMRSAAALGAGTVVLDRGCADPWSPKALRAGMGGQFQVCIRSASELADELRMFDGKLVCTVPKGGKPLPEAELSGRLGWIFGAEGQGVSAATAKYATLQVTIPMAPGAESLNVAAAAAICLYEAYSKPPRPSATPLVRGAGQ